MKKTGILSKCLIGLALFLVSQGEAECSAENVSGISGYINTRYLLSQKIYHSFHLAKTNVKGLWSPSPKIGCGIEAYFYAETDSLQAGSIYGEFRDLPELGHNAVGKLVAGRERNHCSL